jgi:hypothetical protein
MQAKSASKSVHVAPSAMGRAALHVAPMQPCGRRAVLRVTTETRTAWTSLHQQYALYSHEDHDVAASTTTIVPCIPGGRPQPPAHITQTTDMPLHASLLRRMHAVHTAHLATSPPPSPDNAATAVCRCLATPSCHGPYLLAGPSKCAGKLTSAALSAAACRSCGRTGPPLSGCCSYSRRREQGANKKSDQGGALVC